MSNNDLTTNTPKNHLPNLLTEKGLSEECKAIIGESNLQDYVTLHNSDVVEAYTQIIEYYIDMFPEYIEIYYNKLNCNMLRYYKVHKPLNSKLHWEHNGEERQGFLSLLAHMHESPVYQEACKLGSFFNLKYENFRGVLESQNSIPFRADIDSSYYAPDSLLIDKELMLRYKTIPFIKKAGDIYSYLCIYKSKNNKIIVIPSGLFLKNPKEYSQGFVPQHYCSAIGMPHEVNFLNTDVLNQNQNATVFWPMDLLIANKLHNFIAGSTALDFKDYVVLGHYGGLLLHNKLNLKALAVRDVVLLPAISRQGMLDAVKLAQKCYEEGARSVKICTSPCLPFPPASTLDGDNLRDPWEREIVSQAIDLEAVDAPAYLFRKLEEHAVNPSEFIAWGKECAVFKDKRHEDSDLSSNTDALDVSPVSVFPAHTIEDEPTNAPCDLDRLISTESRTMLFSPSDCGKSFLVLHLALAIAYGGQTSVFKATKSRKVLILDGEIGPALLKARVKEIQGKYLFDLEDKDNFYFLGIRKAPCFSHFALSTEESQNALLKFCKEHFIEVLFLDNIGTLWSAVADGGKALSHFFDFLAQFENEGIAVIVVHHSTKDGQQIKGPSHFISHVQTIIELGKLSEKDHKQYPDLQQYVDAKGALCKCTLTKAKMLPEVADDVFYLHLPLHSGRWKDVTPRKEGYLADKNSSDEATSDNTTSNSNDNDASTGLSRDEEKLLEHFKDKKHKLSREDVENFLGCKKDKALKVLNRLLAGKRIDQVGGGRSVTYCLRES